MGTPQVLQVRFHNTVPVFTLPWTSVQPARAFGATLDKMNAEWIFPAFHPFGLRVADDLEGLFGESLTLTENAQKCVAYLQRVPQLIADKHIPNGYKFSTEPMEHQLEALCAALYSPRFGLFAEMGLGKTKVAIDMMEILNLSEPDLRWIVLVSRAGLYVWEDELARHGSGAHACFTLDGAPAKKIGQIEAAIESRDKWLFMVATYESAKNLQPYLPLLRGRGLICDESHKIRRTQSGNTKATYGLSATMGRRVLMTGTPALGDPMHIYAQMQVLAPFVLTRNRRAFVQSHVVTAASNPHITVGYKNMEALNKAIQPLVQRYKQEDCMALPERMIITRTVKADRSIKKHYNEFLTEAATIVNGREVLPGNAAVIVSKLQQLCSGFIFVPLKENICDGCARLDYCVNSDPLIRPYTKRCEVNKGPAPKIVERIGKSQKLVMLESIMDEALANETSKIIIWCTFTPELVILEEYLKTRKDSAYVRVDGSITKKRAKEHEVTFQTDPMCRVYLAQVATGESITLTAADYLVYYSSTFRLDHYLQSMARNFRKGQERKTFVYQLVTDGSIEEYVYANLERKNDISESLTTKVNCVLCDRRFMCLVEGIDPFTAKCKYNDAAGKVRSRPKSLPLLR